MNKTFLTTGLLVAFAVLVTTSTVSAKTLSVGSSGTEVVKLQTWLINNGYPIPLIEQGKASKGYFGVQTSTAVKIYQEDKGVDVTGVVDSEGYGNDTLRLGAVSGPDFYSDYFNVNGVKGYYNSKGLVQASTTVCSIKSPSATSTLSLGSITFRLASTSATYVELARATTPYATTTRIGSPYVIAANAQASIVASSTGSVAGDGTIFPPSTYFNVKVSWATAATSASVPTGTCQGVFTAI